MASTSRDLESDDSVIDSSDTENSSEADSEISDEAGEPDDEWIDIEGDYEGSPLAFLGQAGPWHIPDGTTRPIQFYRLFFTEELLNMIIRETNHYPSEEEQ